mgnify:CR=1 FL=1
MSDKSHVNFALGASGMIIGAVMIMAAVAAYTKADAAPAQGAGNAPANAQTPSAGNGVSGVPGNGLTKCPDGYRTVYEQLNCLLAPCPAVMRCEYDAILSAIRQSKK